jgi:hypothetical protein
MVKKNNKQKTTNKKENEENKGTSFEVANGNGRGGNSESKSVTG